jgi:succinyl-CoA synthetase beta subunit
MTVRIETSPHMLVETAAADLLASFDIPYVAHELVATPEGAVAAATRIGYPVVLKVVSADVVHKTEVGGVVVGIKDEPGLHTGFAELLRRVAANCPGARIEGVLVTRQTTARRELIVGAVRDVTFGPTVMVGLGGVFAEALEDVAFRVAPLRHRDGLDMLGELHAAAVLGTFRGEGAVDRDRLANMLVGVGTLMIVHPEIREIDLNPVAIADTGCVALDARIITAE